MLLMCTRMEGLTQQLMNRLEHSMNTIFYSESFSDWVCHQVHPVHAHLHQGDGHRGGADGQQERGRGGVHQGRYHHIPPSTPLIFIAGR